MSTKKAYEKLPVFIICGKSPIKSYGGGYSTFALHLAKILVRIGHPVYIVAIGEKNEKKTLKGCGTLLICKSFFSDYYTTALPSLPLSSYLFAKKIKSLVDQNDIDRFIIWGIGPWGFAGTLLKWRFKKRVIFLNNYFTTTQHEWRGGYDAIRISDYGYFVKIKFFLILHTVVPFLTLFEKYVLRYADIIVTNYQSTEDILKKQFHVSSKKFFRTTFLVQLYHRQAKEGKEIKIAKLPKNYVLYLSRHDPRKGINYLLHAIALLKKRNKNYFFVIGGTGQLLEANKKLASNLGIEKMVSFIGFVNNTLPVMKRAAVFCFPTIEEGAGALIINEAMSLGMPIVSTSCDGIVEDIHNRESGILVLPKDAEALADAIEIVMTNDNLRNKLGKAAKKRFEKQYSFSRMAKDIETLVKRISTEKELSTQHPR